MSTRMIIPVTTAHITRRRVHHTLSQLNLRAGGQHSRNYFVSSCLGVGEDWRKQRGLPKNYNASGPLTDGPDYSFIDGRPTPLGSLKIRRAEKQLQLTKKVMELSSEMDFAVEFHKKRSEEKIAKKSNILQRKLKPKAKEIQE